MISIDAQPISENFISARPDVTAIAEPAFRAHTKVTSLLKNHNEIWLGKPQVFNLVALYQASGEKLPANIQILSQKFDLIVTQLSCSFRSAPECEFVRATLRAWMETKSVSADKPIALDMFPIAVEVPVSCKRGFSIAPEIKLSFAKVLQVESSAFDAEISQKYIKYEPEVTAFGLGESSPGWDLNKTNARTIRGVKEFFILIKKPIGVLLNMKFEMSAEVKTEIGAIPIPRFISGTGRLISEESFLIP